MCAPWHKSQVELQIDFKMTMMRTPIAHVVRRSDLLHLSTYQMVVKTACIRGEGDRMYAEFDGRHRSRPGSPKYSMNGSTSRPMRSLNRWPAGSGPARHQDDRGDRSASRGAVLVTRSQRRCPPAMRALSLPCVMRALSSPPRLESLNPLVLLGNKPDTRAETAGTQRAGR